MDKFKKIVGDIKRLKIQGANNVALNSAIAIKYIINNTETKNINQFLKKLFVSKEIISKARPTEPCLRITLNFIFYKLKPSNVSSLKYELKQRIEKAIHHLQNSNKMIALVGAKKITNGMIIFTHCHSSTVTAILKKAAEQGKHFEVHNTETRPLYQGRITAKELAAVGIPVVHFVDSGARYALKKADMMLIGADAITSTGKVINKIGSELFAEVANKHDIPVYTCTDSWKFDPKTIFGYEEEIEERIPKEIWKNPPKGVQIHNYAFEKVDADLITGIISELGVYNPFSFIQELKKKNKWMF